MRQDWISLSGMRSLFMSAALLAGSPGLLVSAPAHADGPVTVLYHEPLVLNHSDAVQPKTGVSALQSLPRSTDNNLTFDAFGRRFELELNENIRLNRQRTGAGYTLLQGSVRGAPDSWVRLMRQGDELSGMIRDTTDTYVIEPRTLAVNNLLTTDTATSVNIIYRLADTLIAQGELSCGMADAPVTMNGQMVMDALVSELASELQTVTVLQAQGAQFRASVGVVADFDFFTANGSIASTEATILSRFNIVDGIYSEQLAIEIDVTEIDVSESPGPFTDTTNPEALLDELRIYREMNQAHLAMTHLITGRNLDGSTAGIAYQARLGNNGQIIFGICDNSTGASLSQGTFSTLSSALIIAHELGHNFGAPHDGEAAEPGEPVNPCESTPTTFLMAPDINSNDQFSQCSLTQMQPVVSAAIPDCLTVVPQDGIAVSAPSSVSFKPATPFNLNFTITNIGPDTATNVTAQLMIPGLLTTSSLTVSGGICDLATASCVVDPISRGTSQTIIVGLQSDVEGNYAVTAQATTDIDDDLSDNSATTSVAITNTPQSNSDDGGGGGALGGFGVTGLALLVWLRRRRYNHK
jgi:MYXO-CTERM domain-containing protein